MVDYGGLYGGVFGGLIVRWNDVGLFNNFRDICTSSYQQMKN